jgi:hypothetical protein
VLVQRVVPRRLGAHVQHRLQGREDRLLTESALVAGRDLVGDREVEQELLVRRTVGHGAVSHLDQESVHPAEREQRG